MVGAEGENILDFCFSSFEKKPFLRVNFTSFDKSDMTKCRRGGNPNFFFLVGGGICLQHADIAN